MEFKSGIWRIIWITAFFVAVATGQNPRQLKGPNSTSSAGIEFVCEDLSSVGLILVPPSSREYAPLLAQIEELIERHPFDPPYMTAGLRARGLGEILPEDHDTSAILVNRSGKTVAAFKLVWRFEDENGHIYVRYFTQIADMVLLPFEGPHKWPISSTALAYWYTIVPGSKRYFGGGLPAGDNTDVRPPRQDEVGPFGFTQRRRQTFFPRAQLKRGTLSLDGVMFEDGTFVGPNRNHLWEQIVYNAEAHLHLAGLARKGLDSNAPPLQILNAVKQLARVGERLPEIPEQTSANPDAPWSGFPYSEDLPDIPESTGSDLLHQFYLQKLAGTVEQFREFQGDQRAIDMLVAWGNSQVPNFRKQ